MWQDDGLEWGWPIKVWNGPNLQALVGSQIAYLGKATQLLGFDLQTNSMWYADKHKELCVEYIVPFKGERVDVFLRDKFDGSSRYRILGYNPVKRKGTLEVSKQAREPIQYLPAKLTMDTSAMMDISDMEFVMAYALQMVTYKLPARCEHRGCTFVIRSPLDLRKHGGAVLCPVHFPESAEKSDSRYLVRAAQLLPRSPQPQGLWLHHAFEDLVTEEGGSHA